MRCGCFLLFNNVILGYACRSHCNMLLLVVSILYLVFLVLLVLSLLFVVAVDRVFIFFCDGRRHSQADSSVQCRIIVCAWVERCIFVVGLVILGFAWFSLEVHAFHGFDSCVFFCCISVLYHCLPGVALVVVVLYESPRR